MADPEIAQRGPYAVNETPGKKAWCACGRSRNQPYCDGSHQGGEFRPVIVEIDEPREVFYCGCKRSGNPPYCDGTHSSL